MRDDELVTILGEAIRRVLINEHYPNCTCSKILRNQCNKRRLEEAFQLYSKVLSNKPNEPNDDHYDEVLSQEDD